MSHQPMIDHIDGMLRTAETALRAAQLAGNVGALDRLVHDTLMFTGPDGAVYGTRVWRRTDDGWRIVAGHVSGIAAR